MLSNSPEKDAADVSTRLNSGKTVLINSVFTLKLPVRILKIHELPLTQRPSKTTFSLFTARMKVNSMSQGLKASMKTWMRRKIITIPLSKLLESSLTIPQKQRTHSKSEGMKITTAQ
jgi:hypothetical protein